MRERFGFTAPESLDMPYLDFCQWLSALADDEPSEEKESNDTWEAVTDRST